MYTIQVTVSFKHKIPKCGIVTSDD